MEDKLNGCGAKPVLSMKWASFTLNATAYLTDTSYTQHMVYLDHHKISTAEQGKWLPVL